MAKRVELKARISADARAYYRTLGKVKSATMNVAKYMAAAGVGASIFSVRAAASFSRQMAELNTILGVTPRELKRLGDGAREMSMATGLAASDIADAMYQAASAGVEAADMLEFMEVSAKAAVGGVTTMTIAVDGITSVLNAYGLEVDQASRVSDLFFTAVKRGKTTIPELAENIGMVAPAAAQAGIGVEELMAAYGTLTKQGVKTTVATTQIRSTMMMLLSPTGDLEKALKKLEKQQGVTSWKTLGLNKTLDLLTQQAGGTAEGTAELFTNARALSGVLGMTGSQADMAAESLDMMHRSAGAAGKAFNTMLSDDSVQFSRIMANFMDKALVLGQELLPVVADLTNEFGRFIDKEENVEMLAQFAEDLADSLSAAGMAAKALIGYYNTMMGAADEVRETLGGLTPVGMMIGQAQKFIGSRGHGDPIAKETLKEMRYIRRLQQRRLPEEQR